MLHGWQAKVAGTLPGWADLVALYREDDRGQIERCYLNVEEAQLLADELLSALKKIRES